MPGVAKWCFNNMGQLTPRKSFNMATNLKAILDTRELLVNGLHLKKGSLLKALKRWNKSEEAVLF